MKTFKWTGIFIVITLLLVAGFKSSFNAFGQSNPQVFRATFEVSQAVPAPATAPDNAFGEGVFFFNPEDKTLVFQVALTGLTSSIRALQFHNAAAGEAGDPLQTICGEGPAGVIGTPLVDGPCKSGTSHVMQQRWELTDHHIQELFAGRLYVNVHTETNFAPGEIRAQIVAAGS